MPIPPLVRVRRADVVNRAQTNEHGLNGPFKEGEQDVVGGDSLALVLESVYSDEREAALCPASNI